MTTYTLRSATLDDVPILLHHREAMFTAMGEPGDYEAMKAASAEWLRRAMTDYLYFAWVIETETGDVIAGGGLSVLPWPPNPHDPNHQRAFIYNLYTEPAHQRRGLARRLMTYMQQWCRDRGIKTIGLHASETGRLLYEQLGYQSSNEMILELSQD